MPAIVTDKFRVANAKSFKDTFGVDDYMFVGKVSEWSDDTSPPIPQDSNNEHAEIWRSMIGAKKLSASNASLSIRRINWDSGTVYNRYDSTDQNLLLLDFYVVTDELKVYKCIGNANGASSTIKPTATGANVFTLGDGYQWKYMFTVGGPAATAFLTPQFVPCSDTPNPDTTLGSGALTFVKIINGGTGYATAPTIVVRGNGTGGSVTVTVSGGAINTAVVSIPGTGYSFADLEIIGGGGSGGKLEPILTPVGGHGADPINELGAYNVTVNGRFEYGEGGDVSTKNDFRIVGLVRGPYVFGTTVPFADSTARQTYRLTLTGVSGTFAIDDTVMFNSGQTGKVVEFDAGNNYLYVNEMNSNPLAEAITSSSSGSATVTSILNPEMQPSSGDMMYIEYRAPLSRSDDQIEDIKVTFEY